jgi:hypothetical protein
MARTISTIAQDILKSWVKPSPYAMPYIKAMLTINSTDPNTKYILEPARDIILYFLANAQTFRGEDARRLKTELKQLINYK